MRLRGDHGQTTDWSAMSFILKIIVLQGVMDAV
jgi:hypothetical protein